MKRCGGWKVCVSKRDEKSKWERGKLNCIEFCNYDMRQRECDKCSLSRCCCGCRRRCCRFTDEMKNRQRQQLIAYNMQYVCRSWLRVCVCLVYNAAATMTARQYIALRVETVTHSFMNFLFHKITIHNTDSHAVVPQWTTVASVWWLLPFAREKPLFIKFQVTSYILLLLIRSSS